MGEKSGNAFFDFFERRRIKAFRKIHFQKPVNIFAKVQLQVPSIQEGTIVDPSSIWPTPTGQWCKCFASLCLVHLPPAIVNLM